MNTKKKRFITTMLLTLSVSVLYVNAQTTDEIVRTKYIFDKKIPSVIDIEQKENSDAKGKIDGKSYLEKLLQLNSETTAVLVDTYTDSIGGFHEVYKEYYKGVEVDGSKYALHYNKDGNIYRASGCFWTVDDLSTTHILSESEALQFALKHIGAEKYAWEDARSEQLLKEIREDSTATYYPKGDFLVHIKDSKPFLAYKFPIFSVYPCQQYYVYIDATNGEFIEKYPSVCNISALVMTKYSDAQYIQTKYIVNNYVLRDNTRGHGVETYKFDLANSMVDYTSSNNTWNLSSVDRNALDVHWGVEKTYDFYLSKFGRNSYDNQGAKIVSVVNDTIDGAEWRSFTSSIHFGDHCTGDDSNNYPPIVGLDIVAHEFAHAFTHSTSNLYYANESGAINEGISDAFAVCVESWAKPNTGDNKWKIGEDVYTIRDLKNPDNSVCIYYQGNNWVSSTSNPSNDNDHGGVHTNSGVFGHWFYLISNGGSGENETNDAIPVSGIGLDKAISLCYHTNKEKLGQLSNYYFLAESTLEMANELNFTVNEINQIRNAWYDVGIIAYGPSNLSRNSSDISRELEMDCKLNNDQLIVNISSGHTEKYEICPEKLEIYNASTGSIKWLNNNINIATYSINTKGWEPDIYIVRLTIGRETISKKFMLK